MAEQKQQTVTPELKLAAQLLRDTGEKLEALQAKIDELEGQQGPGPAPRPNGAPHDNRLNFQRQQLEAERENLKTVTQQIVDDIHKEAKGQDKEKIASMKEEWLIDIEPMKENEDEGLRRSGQEMNRMRGDKWKAADMPVHPETEFQQNERDVASNRNSLMDRARGLQQDYDYLNIREPDGLEIEQEEP
jgi:BMFP domain-containing protein YqiC